MESLIADAGQIPVERDTLYNIRQVSQCKPKELPPLKTRLASLINS